MSIFHPAIRFPLAGLLLALAVVLTLGDHGPAWLLGELDDERDETC